MVLPVTLSWFPSVTSSSHSNGFFTTTCSIRQLVTNASFPDSVKRRLCCYPSSNISFLFISWKPASARVPGLSRPVASRHLQPQTHSPRTNPNSGPTCPRQSAVRLLLGLGVPEFFAHSQ
ncbi:hypothetical protein P879_06235 [Paragonimus westermani]|uniref:Uncharacterized protein n=1 Tax=Paragonimus westermani TaxID=34504 RepID=A0A8T0DDE0_9TREM|nr:hypothetical protein P879_06235 [Paragonimus westermani]